MNMIGVLGCEELHIMVYNDVEAACAMQSIGGKRYKNIK